MSFGPLDSAYVQLPFTVNQQDLEDAAIEFLQTQWLDWVPAEASGEVINLEALSPMAVAAAEAASNMPPAALIAFGTKLLGVAYEAGVQAHATATFTVQDADGPYDIPQGAEIDISGVAFQTSEDLVVPNGSTTGSVLVVCNTPGVVGNGFDGTNWSPVTLPVYVTDMTLGADTTGGVDPQDDTDYLNALSTALRLRARSYITLPDLEIAAILTAGVGRALAVADGTHPRDIDIFVTDPEGAPLLSGITDALTALYDSASVRMVNVVITVEDPVYTAVSVTYEAQALPTIDATGLQAMIDARLAGALDPAAWGAPTSSNIGVTWVDSPVVRINHIIGVIASVDGVGYVVSVSLAADDVAELRSALSTGGAITTLPAAALLNTIASGAVVTVTSGVHTQTWTLTSQANPTDTSIHVTSQTPNFAYPIGSKISGPVVGDLTMNDGNPGALTEAGTMTGTVDSAVL